MYIVDDYSDGSITIYQEHFDFSVLSIIKNTGKGVSGSDKKMIQKGSVFNKITS